MKLAIRFTLLGLALFSAAAVFWLYATAAGREWRFSRMNSSDLLAHTLTSPGDVQAQVILGRRLLAEGRAEEAASAFAAAAAADPGCTSCRVQQGRALVRSGKPQQAIQPLEEALRARPHDAEALTAVGEAYYALGDRGKALEFFRSAVKYDNSLAEGWAGLAFALADSHQHDQAKDAAQRALRLAPNSSLASEALGYALSAAGDTAGAIRSLQKAVEIDPKNGRAWGLLAAARVRAARSPLDFKHADDALAKADDLLPGSPLVPYYRGLLFNARRDYPAAIAEFRRALDRKPDYTDALYNLSVALALAGRKEESAQVRARFERRHDYERDLNNLQLQLGRDPTSIVLWRNIEKLAINNGDRARARIAQERIRALESGLGPSSRTP